MSVVDSLVAALDTHERGQVLGRAVHVDALVHWAGFLFRCVIPKRSSQRQMFTVALAPYS
jgi:hypothetical protein